MSEKWVFKQLAGPRKRLELSGWAAPFGRPRQTEVADDVIEIREDTQYYSGLDAEPVRHIFGARYEPIELEGRWMDSWGGNDFALLQQTAAKRFVADQQDVQITWGEVLSYRGFIKRLSCKFESPHDIAWTMLILIDKDDNIEFRPDVPTPRSPSSYTNRILEVLAESLEDSVEIPPTMKADLLTSLGSLISSVNSVSAELLRAADSLGTFEKNLFQQLGRFRAGLRQFRMAINRFKDVYESAQADAALESQNADAEVQLWKSQGAFSKSYAAALSEIVKADREAKRAQRGSIFTLSTAKEGDTWEMLARRVYGDATRADDIRDANGIAPGAFPEPGASYIMPR